MEKETRPGEYELRIRRFQEKLKEKDLQGALVFQPADLFYLAGACPDGHLFIPSEGKPVLLGYGGLERAREEAAWQPVFPVTGFRDIRRVLIELGFKDLKRLGTEMDVIPLKLFSRYQTLFPDCEWQDISPDIRVLRMVKSPGEIEAIRYAASRHSEVFHYIKDRIRPGMTELEIAADLEGYARRLGHQGRVRFRGLEQGMPAGVVAAGRSGTYNVGVPWTVGGHGLSGLYPMGAGNRRWEPGEPLLVDYPGAYGDYLVDQTRVYFTGQVERTLERAQAVACEIAEFLAEAARPGAVAGELYALAEKKARQAGLAEYFMGFERKAGFVGHGVGLELNEWPVLAPGEETVLQAGMVVAIEPKFVFPGWGAVGVEDTYLITEHGARRLTQG
ncbi:MAG: Xaa-Pro peptidase family protein [Thermanaeromonas sp.]|uniref:M24 family metallopeptidase n=1 Tax=Thermanaeromonas sp. TaxID=2003697 RepID=UPI00243ADF46|nr:Xaa-Pro peptidase family protein [Thermanaeromonas sp.]MCG0277052.1 Xaa-Pro peptidase family protein [Thermanaeromonas sp.]